MEKIIIGSRGSELALKQSEQVAGLLSKAAPGTEFAIKIIRTVGDKIQDRPLHKIGDKGVFIKEIEEALLNGSIDLAVHSLKDVPSALPEGLIIAAVTKRADPRDVFISTTGCSLARLPYGSVLGTGSMRRIAMLKHYRPDLQFFPVRGNINTRYRKLTEGQFAGLVLAYAGLIRVGWEDKVTEIIPPDILIPAACQGVLGIETRADDSALNELVSKINHQTTGMEISAERAFLRRLEGGCHVPAGALAAITGGNLHLQGVVASPDGKICIRDQVTGSSDHSRELGETLAEKLLSQGGDRILAEVKRERDNYCHNAASLQTKDK